eukprot:3266114-Lingulodinium_polyedra.AAC.1
MGIPDGVHVFCMELPDGIHAFGMDLRFPYGLRAFSHGLPDDNLWVNQGINVDCAAEAMDWPCLSLQTPHAYTH